MGSFMLAYSLGLAWLLLAPFSLWVLVRGRNLARIGALATLALLEGGTIMLDAAHKADLGPAVVAHDVIPPAPKACTERMPVPSEARVHDGLTLSWPAAPDECDTAKVVLRHNGHRLRVWVHEGPLQGTHTGVQTLPVHVASGSATLHVPLDLPRKHHYQPIDGRSGHRIPRS